MAPADFNALCEGYENKKQAEQELMRQQTFMLISPYLDKGSSYQRFKNQWRFSWEKPMNVISKEDMPTPEQIEQIKLNHSRILANAKSKK